MVLTTGVCRAEHRRKERPQMTFSVRYNVLNSAAILTYNQAFVPNGPWLAPLSVLTPRFAKIGAQISF